MAGYVTTASTNGSDIGEPADTELTWHSICLVVLLCILITVTVVSRPVLGFVNFVIQGETGEGGGRTRWPHVLRLRSATASLLGLRVRIPPEGMDVCLL